jgi:hypothetical protein
MASTSRWVRARTWAVVAVGAASALPLVFGAAPAGAATGRKVSVTYSCTASVPIVGNETFSSPIAVSGKTPASVAPGGAVKMTGFQSSVTISSSFVNEAISYGITSISGKITTFDILATDAKSATVNAAKKAITIPSTKLVENEALTLTLPKTAITIGSWTASKKGKMTFTSGKVAFSLVTSLATVPVSCTASKPPAISTTTVS